VAYCSQADLLERITAQELTDLTDDSGAGEPDAGAVARAIADADAELDAYLGKRYRVPLSPAPELVRKLSVELAVYHLYSRRRGAPEEWRQRYEDNRRLLEHIARGRVSLGAAEPEGSPAGQPVDTASQPRIFTRRTLEGF